MDKHINKYLCFNCRGACCKESGCIYIPEDFINKKFTYELDNNHASISCFLRIKDNKLDPILFIKARNKDSGVVDLLSFNKECSNLTASGCSLLIKPYGAYNLIPKRNNNCYNEVSEIELIFKWNKYQDELKRLVKVYTGKCFNEVLNNDIYNYLFELSNCDMDKLSKTNLSSIKYNLSVLNKTYSLVYDKFNDKIKKYR